MSATTPVTTQQKKSTALPSKVNKHKVFVYWCLNHLITSDIISESEWERLYSSFKFFDSVEDQVAFYTGMEESFETFSKTLKDLEKNKKISAAAATASSKKTKKQPKKQEQQSQQDEIVHEVLESINEPRLEETATNTTVAKLSDPNYQKMTIDQLKTILKARKLLVKGNKTELIHRILEHHNSQDEKSQSQEINTQPSSDVIPPSQPEEKKPKKQPKSSKKKDNQPTESVVESQVESQVESVVESVVKSQAESVVESQVQENKPEENKPKKQPKSSKKKNNQPTELVVESQVTSPSQEETPVVTPPPSQSKEKKPKKEPKSSKKKDKQPTEAVIETPSQFAPPSPPQPFPMPPNDNKNGQDDDDNESEVSQDIETEMIEYDNVYYLKDDNGGIYDMNTHVYVGKLNENNQIDFFDDIEDDVYNHEPSK